MPVVATAVAVPPQVRVHEAASAVRAAEVGSLQPDPGLAELAADILDLPRDRAPGAAVSAESLAAMVESVDASAEIPDARTLQSGSWGALRVEAGTRVEVSVHGSEIRIGAAPGLVLSPRVGPDMRINRLTYDVDAREFDVDASGPGPDFVYRSAASWIANRSLGDLLPPELRAPAAGGQGGGSAITRALAVLNRVTGGADGVASQPAGEAPDLVAPRGSVVIRTSREIRHDLDNGMRLTIPANTAFHVSARMTGPVSAPELEVATVRVMGPGVVIRHTTGPLAELNGLRIHGATLRPGGQVDLDYELLAERAIGDGINLIRLFAAVAGAERGDPRGLIDLQNNPAARVRLDSFRADVQTAVDTELEPALIELVRTHDGAIPGLALTGVLGVPAAD